MGSRVKREDRLVAIKDVGEDLRKRGGVPWQSAVVEGGERHEYFRGKDFARHLREHRTKMAPLVDAGRPLESQIEDVMDMLIACKHVFACERFFKKPHPGRKHLVKFPRKLTHLPNNQQKFKEDYFYAWTEERPTPAWQHVLSILMVVFVVAVCLFPLAPYWLRISVVYFFLGLLTIIFGILLVRGVVFGLIFVTTGYEFWLLPNVVSEEVDFLGAFVPLYAVGKPEDGKSHVLSRVAALVGSVVFIYVLYVYSPDEADLVSGVGSAHDSILDMLNLNPHKPGLGAGSGAGAGEQYTGPPKFGAEINPEKAAKQLYEWRKAQKAAQEEAARQAEADAASETADSEAEASASQRAESADHDGDEM